VPTYVSSVPAGADFKNDGVKAAAAAEVQGGPVLSTENEGVQPVYGATNSFARVCLGLSVWIL
jgi:hypothetical protein